MYNTLACRLLSWLWAGRRRERENGQRATSSFRSLDRMQQEQQKRMDLVQQ